GRAERPPARKRIPAAGEHPDSPAVRPEDAIDARQVQVGVEDDARGAARRLIQGAKATAEPRPGGLTAVGERAERTCAPEEEPRVARSPLEPREEGEAPARAEGGRVEDGEPATAGRAAARACNGLERTAVREIDGRERLLALHPRLAAAAADTGPHDGIDPRGVELDDASARNPPARRHEHADVPTLGEEERLGSAR